MKIALGMIPREGPWGGGMQFAKLLEETLRAEGHEVVFHLRDRETDLILLTHVSRHGGSSAFGDHDVARFLITKNPKTLVVYRSNFCGEHRGRPELNQRFRVAAGLADHTIFISQWLQETLIPATWPCADTSVIHNGADARVFHPAGRALWDGREPLRLVTHHWSDNLAKGWDVYAALDALLEDPAWRGRIHFTYVGRLPKGVALVRGEHKSALHGEALANELRTHHVYVTGALSEAAGMHHIEAGCCGLPILYRDSGALPEYCRGFGVQFGDLGEIPQRLREMMDEYDRWSSGMSAYPHDHQRMISAYVELMRRMIDNRRAYLARRSMLRIPRWFWQVRPYPDQP